jgi:hypothetical protein
MDWILVRSFVFEMMIQVQVTLDRGTVHICEPWFRKDANLSKEQAHPVQERCRQEPDVEDHRLALPHCRTMQQIGCADAEKT